MSLGKTLGATLVDGTLLGTSLGMELGVSEGTELGMSEGAAVAARGQISADGLPTFVCSRQRKYSETCCK